MSKPKTISLEKALAKHGGDKVAVTLFRAVVPERYFRAVLDRRRAVRTFVERCDAIGNVERFVVAAAAVGLVGGKQESVEPITEQAVSSVFAEFSEALAVLRDTIRSIDKQRERAYVAIPTNSEATAVHRTLVREVAPRARTKRGDNVAQVITPTKLFLVDPNKPASTPTQLYLELETDFDRALVRQLHEAVGPIGLRHWAALLAAFTEGGRTGCVRWTIDAHLRRMGYSSSHIRRKETRLRHLEIVKTLSRLKMVIETLKTRAEGNLITFDWQFLRKDEDGDWIHEAAIVRINPQLYRGVREVNGKAGKRWVALSENICRIDHRHQYAAGLGLVLAFNHWAAVHISPADELVFKCETLIEDAGITDSKAIRRIEALDRTLDVLKEHDLLGNWRKDGQDLDAKYYLTTPRQARDFLLGIEPGMPLRSLSAEPDGVPITGQELRKWRKAREWTQKVCAEQLGVSRATIKRAEHSESISTRLKKQIAALK